jgi:hypothetical protein
MNYALLKYNFFCYNIPDNSATHSGVLHTLRHLPVAATVAGCNLGAVNTAAPVFISEFPMFARSATGLNLNPVTISHIPY